MTREITETDTIVTEPKYKRLFVLKDDKGRYYSTSSRHHWTDDINDAKTLMRYKRKGDVPHLTSFEKLYIQEVKLVEVSEE